MKRYVLQNLWRNITRYLTEYVTLTWLIWYKIQYILLNRRLSVPVHIWYKTLDRGINWFIRNYILSASVFYILMSIDYYWLNNLLWDQQNSGLDKLVSNDLLKYM